MTKTNRLSFDIGGTFTDIVLHKHSENEFCIHKCLTTPNDPSKGSINGINELLYQDLNNNPSDPLPFVLSK